MQITRISKMDKIGGRQYEIQKYKEPNKKHKLRQITMGFAHTLVVVPCVFYLLQNLP